jgi:hypothetical protein
MDGLRSIYYDLGGLTYGPEPGSFLVSVGKHGIGTIYHVAEARKSKTRNRYNLKVYVANDLKPDTQIEVRRFWVRRRRSWQPASALPFVPAEHLARWGRRKNWRIMVHGSHAWLLHWYPRTKKS